MLKSSIAFAGDNLVLSSPFYQDRHSERRQSASLNAEMEFTARDCCGSPDFPGYDSDDDAEDVTTEGPVVPPSHLVNERAVRLEQQQMGQLVFTPSSRNLLSDMLDEVYAQLQPKPTDWDARLSVIQFITKFVSHKIPGSSFSAFGSFVMDLFTSSSDLDLSLNLADGKKDRARNDKVHFLRKVAKALYGLQNGRQSVGNIETVYRAAVPVVKFVECKTGIECDISVENNDGVVKSQVLGMFSSIDSRFRQLCYLVKAWAKKHNVNSSKNGTLNSLSICLLVAFHLQTCSPPILPPFSVFMEGLYLPAVGSCLEAVASRVREYRDRGFGKDNSESIPELFGSFFLKLIAVESLWGQGLCSSTYEGKWISKIWPKNHIGCISVEDFADRTQNVARSVSRKEFELIYQVLHSTVSNLKDPVFDIPEAKDLKVYLFGSIRQRHRGLDRTDVTGLTIGNWQSGAGWSPSIDRRTNSQNSRGHDPRMDNIPLSDRTWGHEESCPPTYCSHSQDGQDPAYRALAFRKIGGPPRIAKVDSAFAANDHGENRGPHQLHPYDRRTNASRLMQYPTQSRSGPMVDDIKQVVVNQGRGYQDVGSGYTHYEYRNNDIRTRIAERNPSYTGDGYMYRAEDFPKIDSGGGYRESVGFAATESGQVEQRKYDMTADRQRGHPLPVVPPTPSGTHQNQRMRRRRHGQKGRTTHPLSLVSQMPQYNGNSYHVEAGGHGHWQRQHTTF